MANPKPLQDVNDAMKDTAAKARNAAEETLDTASEYYSQASDWVQENYGKTLGMVGIVAAAGVIGYFIGKNNSRSEFQIPTPRA
jgi:hypothetical protein